MEGRCFGVFTLLLLKLVLGVCDESSEEASKEVLGDEYGQIFHSLPTLFEYLLDILHERPEILEKDDVTFFQDVTHGTCKGDEKRKREVDKQCNNRAKSKSITSNAKLDVFKRNIVTNDLSKEKNMNDATEGEVTTTTPKNKLINGSDLHKAATKTKSKSKKDKNKSEITKHEEIANKFKSKSELSKGTTKGTMKVKKNVNFDESFLGSIDWNQFYLTPDEVEEQALKAERAIEEHNRKKGR